MMKTVVHIFHEDPESLTTGSRLPRRMAEVSGDHDVEVEVFVFGPAQRRLSRSDTEADRIFNARIDELVRAGIRVGACVNAAHDADAEMQLSERGLVLSVARDEFLRFTLEGATVVTF
jgi:hypothetical protein